jgi:hypothetical protein
VETGRNQDTGVVNLKDCEATNGLSLCKIHHAAFDRGIIGIRPNYVIEIRKALRENTRYFLGTAYFASDFKGT